MVVTERVPAVPLHRHCKGFGLSSVVRTDVACVLCQGFRDMLMAAHFHPIFAAIPSCIVHPDHNPRIMCAKFQAILETAKHTQTLA